MRVQLGWSTFFRWRGMTWLPRLIYSYRAPTLFGARIVQLGQVMALVTGPDERLLASDYDGRTNRLADSADALYLAGHGRQSKGQFELLLHADEWRPATSGLDGAGPRIVVFDACDLVDPNSSGWAAPWLAMVRPNLRIVLGFASKATVSKAAALRGEEFAIRVMRGDTLASAWIGAVRSHDAHGRDRPAAIAFGRDEAEAQYLLDHGDLSTVLGMPALASSPAARMRI